MKLRYICDDMRHLICLPYSVGNLHQMAEELNIKRCWFHKDHYDIPQRRIDEITEKCELFGVRQVNEMIRIGQFGEAWLTMTYEERLKALASLYTKKRKKI